MKSRQFLIRIESAELGSSVPFTLLADTLKGVQQTVYYMALAELEYDAQKKAVIPQEVRQLCELRRVFERPGSYELTAQINEPNQLCIQGIEDIGLLACRKYLKFVHYLSHGYNAKMLGEIVPDSLHRRRILRSIESYCPKLGDNWYLVIDGMASNELGGKLNSSTRTHIASMLRKKEIEYRVVTGELVRLHLDENRLAINYKPTGKVLDCIYDQEIEDFVIENLRGQIQVIGHIQLNEEGEPEKIVDVSDISELDLDPIRLGSVSHKGTTLYFHEPLTVEPTFDDQAQEIELEVERFGIIACGSTREDAVRDLEEDLVWLWKEYGECNEPLTNDAKELREALRTLVKEATKHG